MYFLFKFYFRYKIDVFCEVLFTFSTSIMSLLKSLNLDKTVFNVFDSKDLEVDVYKSTK